MLYTPCQLINPHFEILIKEDNNNNNYSILFDCLEDSNYCDKNCLSNSNRTFSLKIKESKKVKLNELNNQMHSNFMYNNGVISYNPPSKFDFESDLYAHLLKNYSCTCCCFIRPVLNAYTFENGKKLNHSVVDEYNCCDPILNIKDSNNEIKFTITTKCCKCGYYCCSCCSVENIEFNVFNSLDNDIVAKIIKLRYQEMRYEVKIISEKLSYNDKFEIFSTALFLDSILNLDSTYSN